MKEIICITCPRGCHLKVDEQSFAVTGNACPRGAVYGANELRNPVRVVTSTVVVEPAGANLPRRLPVKTDRPIPMEIIFAVMAELAGLRVRPPVKVGDILLPNVAGTDGNIVATKDLPGTGDK